MATFDSIFYPTGRDATGTVTTGASSAEIALGKNEIFAFTASDDCNIAFGATGMAAADATNFKLFGGSIARYDAGSNINSLRIFNPNATTITYWIQYLAR